MWFAPLLLPLIVWLLPYNVAGYEVPTNFSCKNSLISDNWRKSVLNFHNTRRRNLALGEVLTNGGKDPAPMANNMNELLWDCNMENYAWENACGDINNIAPKYGAITATFQNKKSCNPTTQTDGILRTWWDESKAINLKDTVKYNADAEKKAPHFSQMAAALAKAFACTYKVCAGNELTLMCLYNKKLAPNNNIYVKANSKDKVCTNCNSKVKPECISYLCQQEYTYPDSPFRSCSAKDGMTNDLQAIAEDMHNYYRRLVATGWGEDKIDGYAPRAKTMLGVTYTCGTNANPIGTKTKDLADACPSTKPPATAGYSLNHFYRGTHTLSKEELLKQAIMEWANEAAVAGVGKDNIYTPNKGFDNYANMMHDEVTQVTCSVGVCTAQGKSAVICQYNKPPDEGFPIYQLGKPCTNCPAGTSCDNGLGGGLCVTNP